MRSAPGTRVATARQAGPAFEAGQIKCGSCADDAIEGVSPRREIELNVTAKSSHRDVRLGPRGRRCRARLTVCRPIGPLVLGGSSDRFGKTASENVSTSDEASLPARVREHQLRQGIDRDGWNLSAAISASRPGDRAVCSRARSALPPGRSAVKIGLGRTRPLTSTVSAGNVAARARRSSRLGAGAFSGGRVVEE